MIVIGKYITYVYSDGECGLLFLLAFVMVVLAILACFCGAEKKFGHMWGLIAALAIAFCLLLNIGTNPDARRLQIKVAVSDPNQIVDLLDDYRFLKQEGNVYTFVSRKPFTSDDFEQNACPEETLNVDQYVRQP